MKMFPFVDTVTNRRTERKKKKCVPSFVSLIYSLLCCDDMLVKNNSFLLSPPCKVPLPSPLSKRTNLVHFTSSFGCATQFT
mmetsp:Transcript_47761/g.55247  ORF Transcript_47761/g.55247 Transcript_47761/m.55247 type:complete len:81 (+) Transcript_47761:1249-1491(+)